MLSQPMARLILALVALLIVPQSSTAAIKITRKPAKVVYHEFDPANKPAELPKLNQGEIAVCEGQYGISARVVYSSSTRRQANGAYVARVVVDDVLVELELINNIWLPHGSSAKLKAHEEGHRQIAEMVYDKVAERAARLVADKVDGRRFEGTGATSKEASEAAEAAMNKAQREMTQAYLEHTSRAGQKTQERYDEITAHGTIAEIGEADAIARAFNEVPPPLWPKPATQPAAATRPKSGATTQPATSKPKLSTPVSKPPVPKPPVPKPPVP